jgi:hypothetical protein
MVNVGQVAIPRASVKQTRGSLARFSRTHCKRLFAFVRWGWGKRGRRARAMSGWTRLKRDELQRGFGWVAVDHDSSDG